MMQFGSTFCSPSSKLLVSNLVLGAPSPVKVWGFPGPHLKGCTTSSIHRKPCWKMFGKSPCGSWFPWFPWIPDSRLILLPRFTVLHLLVQSLVCFLFVTPMHAQHCHNGWMHFQSKNQKKNDNFNCWMNTHMRSAKTSRSHTLISARPCFTGVRNPSVVSGVLIAWPEWWCTQPLMKQNQS